MWDSVDVIQSSDENVAKYVFKREDAVAESVLYKYPTYEQRTVICCSTQSGCPVGCRFCGAGDYFVRSLTREEIVSQPRKLLDDTEVFPWAIRRLQIMFMSMGEPLLNLKALVPALEDLYELYPNAALLISTSAPSVDYSPLMDVSERIPTVGLQFSVHESTDAARDALIPFKKKLSLAAIALVGQSWNLRTGRKPFFNYCAHEGNTSEADADRLLAFFPPAVWECTISVICERDESIAAANERQRELAMSFAGKMLARDFSTRTFDPAGQDDIGGGCGQLWFVQDWMRKNPERARPSVGRGLPVIHTPVAA
jgi:23S rRNA (adenine2503-C2)-methyltransferase